MNDIVVKIIERRQEKVLGEQKNVDNSKRKEIKTVKKNPDKKHNDRRRNREKKYRRV